MYMKQAAANSYHLNSGNFPWPDLIRQAEYGLKLLQKSAKVGIAASKRYINVVGVRSASKLTEYCEATDLAASIQFT